MSAPQPRKVGTATATAISSNAAEQAGFDILITTDKNMSYQQNLTDRSIAVILLGKQQWPDLRPYAPLVVTAIGSVVPGSYVEIIDP